jgi:hypothetical protein
MMDGGDAHRKELSPFFIMLKLYYPREAWFASLQERKAEYTNEKHNISFNNYLDCAYVSVCFVR